MEVTEGVRSESLVNGVCEVEDKHVEGGRSTNSFDPPARLLVPFKPLPFKIGFDESVHCLVVGNIGRSSDVGEVDVILEDEVGHFRSSTDFE